MESKTCHSCGETKPRSEFNKHTKNTANHGLSYRCRACQAVVNRERRLARPFENAVAQARYRAKRADVPFDLTEDYLEDIWTGYCPVFGTRFKLPGSAARTPQTPSLDRLVPDRGYVRGNVVWISDLANRIKQEATSDEIQTVATWLRQTEKEIAQHETD